MSIESFSNSFVIIYFYFLIERLYEIYISKKHNLYISENNGFFLHSRLDIIIKILHISWFIFILVELSFKNLVPLKINLIGIIIILLCSLVRITSMFQLSKLWTISIATIPNKKLVKTYLYKYLKHPNYLIVMIEIPLFPLLFHLYYTSIIFGILNIIVLTLKIKKEDSFLNSICH